MNRSTLRWVLTVGVLVTASALPPAASRAAAESVPRHEVLDLDEAAALLRVTPEVVRAMAESRFIPARRVGDLWRFSRAALLEWLKGDQSELATVTARGVAPASGVRLAQVPPPATRQTDSSPPPTVGERPATPTAAEIALRDQRTLVRQGAVTLDVGAAYARSERTLFPIVRAEQRTLGATGTLRYGLLDDVQVTLRVPGIWRSTETFTDATIAGTKSRSSTHENYVGDAAMSLLGVAWREAVGAPTVILSLDSVVPIGPGDAGVGGGFVLSKSFDPGVVFAGLTYLYGVSIDPSDSRRSLARNNFGFHLGYTYALNEALALSTVFSGTYRDGRSPDGIEIPPPRENYQLQLGMTWLLRQDLFVEPSVAVRLGSDNPDLTFSLNLSYSF